MPKNKGFKIFIGILIAVVLLSVIGVVSYFGFSKQTILPELDNRITYWDKSTDSSQTIQVSSWKIGEQTCTAGGLTTCYESDKFGIIKSDNTAYYGSLDYSVNLDSIDFFNSRGSYIGIIFKKDFSELSTFIKVTALGSGRHDTSFAGDIYGNNLNYEIRPDNLNLRT